MERVNIEFIKWMCKKAEGWHYSVLNKEIVAPDGCFYNLDGSWEGFNIVYYPLLLQRAIEGVNNTMNFRNGDDDWTGIYIEQWCNQILVHSREDREYKLFENMPIDEAKESALQYIYEQETKFKA